MKKGISMRLRIGLAGVLVFGLAAALPASAQQLAPFQTPQTGAESNSRTVRVAVLPPRRPASLDAQAPVVAAPASPAPAVVQAAAPAPATAAAPLTDRQLVERANAYFNGLTSLVGDFIQVGGDGRRTTGRLYLQRPGKLRFEYAAPSNLEVIADGSSVAVRDRKLATQDLYMIGQTPLKFLLKDKVALGTDIRVTDVSRDPSGVRISLEDRATLGGTSKITLFFDSEIGQLSQWRIIDPQGFQTSVVLSNVDRSRRIDPQLFVINYERLIEVR